MENLRQKTFLHWQEQEFWGNQYW